MCTFFLSLAPVAVFRNFGFSVIDFRAMAIEQRTIVASLFWVFQCCQFSLRFLARLCSCTIFETMWTKEHRKKSIRSALWMWQTKRTAKRLWDNDNKIVWISDSDINYDETDKSLRLLFLGPDATVGKIIKIKFMKTWCVPYTHTRAHIWNDTAYIE